MAAISRIGIDPGLQYYKANIIRPMLYGQYYTANVIRPILYGQCYTANVPHFQVMRKWINQGDRLYLF